jgi:hypothetical protein
MTTFLSSADHEAVMALNRLKKSPPLKRSASVDGMMTSFATFASVTRESGYDGDVDDVDTEASLERENLRRQRLREHIEAYMMMLRFDRMCMGSGGSMAVCG